MPYLSPRSIIQQNHFQKLALLTKDELNQQDRQGRTLLHWAVISKNWEMVKTLVDKGCRLDICDNQYNTPLYYSTQDSEIEKLLLSKGSPRRRVKAIHLAAKEGDLKKIKLILEKNKSAIHSIDEQMNFPIFYATKYQKEEAVKYLIEQGSIADWTNINQTNLVTISQVNGKDTPLTEFLKKKIGLPVQELAVLAASFKKILEKEYATAKKLNKRIAVVLGELHGNYSIIEVEKAFLKVAKELGINQFYMELPSTNGGDKTEIELEAEELKMKSTRVDDHLFRSDASLDQRNIIMTSKAKQDDQDCVMIVGAAHLKGIVNKKTVRLPQEQFHVVPINLGPIALNTYNMILFVKKGTSGDRSFIDDSDNVIQVSRTGITESAKVLKKYNDYKPSTKSRNAFISFLALVIVFAAIAFPLYRLYLAVGLFLSVAIVVMTAITGYLIHQFIEKQKAFGLKEYQKAKMDLSGIHQEKLKAFMDGATPGFYSKLTSVFSYRDWRYMRDYYAGCAAKEVEKEKLIAKVKARVG